VMRLGGVELALRAGCAGWSDGWSVDVAVEASHPSAQADTARAGARQRRTCLGMALGEGLRAVLRTFRVSGRSMAESLSCLEHAEVKTRSEDEE
jgi:hypothetical protein